MESIKALEISNISNIIPIENNIIKIEQLNNDISNKTLEERRQSEFEFRKLVNVQNIHGLKSISIYNPSQYIMKKINSGSKLLLIAFETTKNTSININIVSLYMISTMEPTILVFNIQDKIIQNDIVFNINTNFYTLILDSVIQGLEISITIIENIVNKYLLRKSDSDEINIEMIAHGLCHIQNCYQFRSNSDSIMIFNNFNLVQSDENPLDVKIEELSNDQVHLWFSDVMIRRKSEEDYPMLDISIFKFLTLETLLHPLWKKIAYFILLIANPENLETNIYSLKRILLPLRSNFNLDENLNRIEFDRGQDIVDFLRSLDSVISVNCIEFCINWIRNFIIKNKIQVDSVNCQHFFQLFYRYISEDYVILNLFPSIIKYSNNSWKHIVKNSLFDSHFYSDNIKRQEYQFIFEPLTLPFEIIDKIVKYPSYIIFTIISNLKNISSVSYKQLALILNYMKVKIDVSNTY